LDWKNYHCSIKLGGRGKPKKTQKSLGEPCKKELRTRVGTQGTKTSNRGKRIVVGAVKKKRNLVGGKAWNRTCDSKVVEVGQLIRNCPTFISFTCQGNREVAWSRG